MLLLENVNKFYDKKHAIDNVNLHVKQGEMVFIVGLSGAGKSTLLKLITREEILSSGSIKIYDSEIRQRIDISSMKPHIYRRRLGIVFQDYKLINAKSVFSNIAYPLEVFGENNSIIKEKVINVANRVGIGELLNKFPDELSGGERQRVGIARALVTNPSIILADEPTGNLDYKTTQDIMNLLENINKSGTTILMITHNTNAVSNAHGRVLQIHEGKIIQDIVK